MVFHVFNIFGLAYIRSLIIMFLVHKSSKASLVQPQLERLPRAGPEFSSYGLSPEKWGHSGVTVDISAWAAVLNESSRQYEASNVCHGGQGIGQSIHNF
jgi:hypothetical protein